jgi:hypothetical protein
LFVCVGRVYGPDEPGRPGSYCRWCRKLGAWAGLLRPLRPGIKQQGRKGRQPTRRSTMKYEKPEIADYGSIADHTFTRCGGVGPKVGDFRTCELDKFGECSCSD